MDEIEQPDVDLSALSLIRPVVVPKIARACKACIHSAEEKPDLVCRYNPPQLTFMAIPEQVPTPQGMRQGMVARPFAAFPVVRPDQWCAKFEQKK